MNQTIETIINKAEGAVKYVKRPLRTVGYSILMGAASLGLADRINSAKADAPPDLPHTLQGDVNRDGIVDIADVRILDSQMGQEEPWYSGKLINVYGPIHITDPDKIYVLQNSLNVSGDFITSSIGNFELDLNNWTVEGDGTGTGISIKNDSEEPIKDVYIYNGRIENFGTNMDIKGVENLNLDDLYLESNKGDYSLILENCSGISLDNVNSNLNDGAGMLMKDCYGDNKVINSSFSQDREGTVDLINTKDVFFLNCVYSYGYADVGPNSSFIRATTYKVKVQNESREPVINARVSAYDSKESLELTARTGPGGYTSDFWLTNYLHIGHEIIHSTPYEVIAEKDFLSGSEIVDPNYFNHEVTLTLMEDPNAPG